MPEKKQFNYTFFISIIITIAVVIWGIASPSTFENMANTTFSFLVDKFGWFYTITMMSFVGFAVWIGFFSKYKNIRLGEQDSKPEYSFDMVCYAIFRRYGNRLGILGSCRTYELFCSSFGSRGGNSRSGKICYAKIFLALGISSMG